MISQVSSLNAGLLFFFAHSSLTVDVSLLTVIILILQEAADHNKANRGVYGHLVAKFGALSAAHLVVLLPLLADGKGGSLLSYLTGIFGAGLVASIGTAIGGDKQ